MLEEKIFNDYREAMKNQDKLKSSALSFLRAEMINVAVAKKKKNLDDNEVISVIRKQIRSHQDSIGQFEIGGRLDLVDKENKELEILKSYLPKEISADEIKKIIEEVVSATGAIGMRDMGRVMKEVMAKVGNTADSRLVSDLVKQRLSKST